jgi:hypothetical protein
MHPDSLILLKVSIFEPFKEHKNRASPVHFVFCSASAVSRRNLLFDASDESIIRAD